MRYKKISVVTPSFNQAAFVEETLKSVLDQNYPNLEYIVIDGGSTDGSADIIRRYSDRLHYFVSEPDTGHANAINRGFRQSTGEIMAWINSDDKYLPWTLQTVSEIFSQHPDIDWISGIATFWNDKGAMIGVGPDAKWIRGIAQGSSADFAIPPYMAWRNALDYLDAIGYVQQESVFWRRSLWQKAGGAMNENYKFMIDGELWSRFFLIENLWQVNCVLAGYRVHNANRASTYQRECVNEMNHIRRVMREKTASMKWDQRQANYTALLYDPASRSWIKHMVPRNFPA